MIFFGIFGNICSIFVLRSKYFWRSSMTRILVVLAIVDSCILIVACGRVHLNAILGRNIRKFSNFACKSSVYIQYNLLTTSSWLLVILTGSRLFGILFPLKSKAWLTIRNEWIAISTVLIVSLLINSYYIFTISVIDTPDGESCLDNSEIFYQIRQWLQGFLPSFLPFILILIGNVTILISVTKSRDIQCNLIGKRREEEEAKIRSMTVILLSISFIFLFTTSPLVIISFLWERIVHKVDVYLFRIFYDIAWILFHLNSVLNFYLYCSSGRPFRQAFLRIIFRKKESKNQSSIIYTIGSN